MSPSSLRGARERDRRHLFRELVAALRVSLHDAQHEHLRGHALRTATVSEKVRRGGIGRTPHTPATVAKKITTALCRPVLTTDAMPVSVLGGVLLTTSAAAPCLKLAYSLGWLNLLLEDHLQEPLGATSSQDEAVLLKNREKLRYSTKVPDSEQLTVPPNKIPGSGGLTVPPRLHALIAKAGTGFLTSKKDAAEFRALYHQQIPDLRIRLFSPFAQACLLGRRDAVAKAVLTGQAPPLDSTATPYGFSYAALVVAGSNLPGHPDPPPASHYVELLDFLLHPAVVPGCPPDAADIARSTALAEAAGSDAACNAALIRVLVARGADIDHRDIFGDTPIKKAIAGANLDAVDVLMELGADITIPDAAGVPVEEVLERARPDVAELVVDWLAARQGT
ncbi:hypothetical protein BV25DRAFT_1921560 [Artomyces pyxidatus]|uniref:Uncharacterized protein n=1 Tax=Artomyces pyxidatus TaxID=48021 RepID=A0ACB8SHL2_9AGAM|nr:hypothetical protein BV25DRAFT_1921560 [Artomyces pyxidatus]